MPSIRLAARTLLRAPLVTAVAVASLALGIGANTAIYSMFQRMLLRPLPVAAPHELVNLSAPGPKQGSTSCGTAGDCDDVFSYRMFRDLEAGQQVLAGIAAHRDFGMNLAFRGQTLDAEGLLVSGSYFPVLGLQPSLGRLLGPSDDRDPGAHPVAVLGHAYWESQLGRDPGVLDQPIVVNGRTLTVVGVAPAGFDGTVLGNRPAVFVPLSMRAAVRAGDADDFEDRRVYWAYLFGRLRPGITAAAARDGLNALYRPIITDVEAPLQTGMSEATMAQFRAREIELRPGARGQSTVGREASTPLRLLFAVTLIVLLIACLNVANLLVARAAERAHEMAVRLSLGARRRQLLGQLLTEAVLLAAVAGAASLLVARWTLALVTGFLPPDAAGSITFVIDGPALRFAGAASLATALLFGLAPALHATRPELLSVIKSGADRASSGRGAARFRLGLVTAQIALSMTLLATAGLFIRSLARASRVDLGLEPASVVTFRLAPVLNGYGPAQSRNLFQRVEEELRALPGVTDVAASRVPVLAGSNWITSVTVEGFERDPDAAPTARYSQVGPGYLRTLGIPLLAGREFTAADDAGAPRVALVNEAFARQFNLGRDAVGRRLGAGPGEPDIEIVGLVRDARYSEVKDAPPAVFLLPYRQDTTIGAMSFYVRARGAPEGLLREIPAVVRRLDPNLPVARLLTLPEQIHDNLFLDRLIGTVATAFAGLATLLAAVGLYAVLAYSVAQRTREIGVRMALGADAGRVRGLVLRQVGLLTLTGGLIGLGAAVALARAARSLLFGVTGHDPLALGGAALALAAVAFGAGYLPARRASRVDPMASLRSE
jgi:predicted permease